MAKYRWQAYKVFTKRSFTNANTRPLEKWKNVDYERAQCVGNTKHNRRSSTFLGVGCLRL